MKWLYLILWSGLTLTELRRLDRKTAVVWLALALLGLALAVWYLWLRTEWRLAGG